MKKEAFAAVVEVDFNVDGTGVVAIVRTTQGGTESFTQSYTDHLQSRLNIQGPIKFTYSRCRLDLKTLKRNMRFMRKDLVNIQFDHPVDFIGKEWCFQASYRGLLHAWTRRLISPGAGDGYEIALSHIWKFINRGFFNDNESEEILFNFTKKALANSCYNDQEIHRVLGRLNAEFGYKPESTEPASTHSPVEFDWGLGLR